MIQDDLMGTETSSDHTCNFFNDSEGKRALKLID